MSSGSERVRRGAGASFTVERDHADASPHRRRNTRMSEQKKVKFYFAYNSPYAFLANTHVEQDLAPLGVSLEYKPVYSPRRGSGPDPNSPKLKYMLADVRRFAEAYGLRLNPGPFADSQKACWGFFFAQEHRRGKAYHDGVSRARWPEGK